MVLAEAPASVHKEGNGTGESSYLQLQVCKKRVMVLAKAPASVQKEGNGTGESPCKCAKRE